MTKVGSYVLAAALSLLIVSGEFTLLDYWYGLPFLNWTSIPGLIAVVLLTALGGGFVFPTLILVALRKPH